MAKKRIKIKESLGIDIGSHSIKAVHLRWTGEGWRFLSAEARSTVPSGMEYIPTDLRSDRFAPVLSAILRAMKINPKKVKHLVTSVGGDNTSIKQIKTIYLPEDELESALFFEAKKHLPISGSEMVLDYQVLSVEEKTNNMNILLSASTKDTLNVHTQALTSAGLVPGIVDIDTLGLTNAFIMNNDDLDEDAVSVLINIGAHRTNMAVWGPNSKFFARDIAWGGYNFIKDVQQRTDEKFEVAEQMLFDKGIKAGVQTTQKLSMLDITEKPTEESLAGEIKRSLRFYVKEAGNSNFKNIWVSGGGAKIKGLAAYIEETLSIPVKVFNPFANVDMTGSADMNDSQFAVAAGLAMRME